MTLTVYKNILVLVSVGLISACNQSPPKCSDESTLQLVREITFGENYTEKELKDNVVFEYTLATAEDKNIKKISCRAKMKVANAYELPITFSSQLDDKNQHVVSVAAISRADAYTLSAVMRAAVEKTRTPVVKDEPIEQSQTTNDTVASKYTPLLSPNQKITMGNCHMGSCSWAKWLTVRSEQLEANEQTLLITLLGGSSDHEDDYPDSPDGVNISWNSDSHAITVNCSYTKPSVSFDEQIDLLPLNVTSSIPDTLFSSVSTYFEACHSDFSSSKIDEKIKKYGYNVTQTE
jgi:hypothetical protein